MISIGLLAVNPFSQSNIKSTMSCAAVKKKGSLQQCPSKPLKGHTLCGRHVRSKHVVLWIDANKSKSHILVRTQAIIRGWLLRKRLALGGPGVLSRKNLANDEDLETCEESSREHPFTYFGFEESGKIWWFSFPTIWKWCVRNPTNPYTKVPLSADTRKRIRQMWYYQRSHRLPLPVLAPSFNDRLTSYWNVIRQIIEDHGFGEIHPNIVLHLRKSQYNVMFRMIRDDIPVTMQNKSDRERVDKYLRIAIQNTTNIQNYILYASYTLMLVLMIPKDPYELCFTILSAMYRC